MHKLLEAINGQWTTEKITLIRMAACTCQKVPMSCGFHILGIHAQPKTLSERHYGPGYRHIVGVNEHIAHKRLVNFQLIERHALEVAEGRIADAEVIQRESHTFGSQR